MRKIVLLGTLLVGCFAEGGVYEGEEDSSSGSESESESGSSGDGATTSTSNTTSASGSSGGSAGESSAGSDAGTSTSDDSTSDGSASDESAGGSEGTGETGGASGQPDEGMYSHCLSSPECLGVDLCVVVDETGFCTSAGCANPSVDCDLPTSGTATPVCIVSMAQPVCALDCSGGKSCPTPMTCHALGPSMICA